MMNCRTYLAIRLCLLFVISGGLTSCAQPQPYCANLKTGEPVPMAYCLPLGYRPPEPYPAYRGPAVAMPPIEAPGMTMTPLVYSDGSTTVCTTTTDGYGGPLTLCQ